MVLEWVGNDIFRFIDQLSGTYSALMQYPIVKGDKIPFYLERGIRSLTYQFCIHFFISFQTFAWTFLNVLDCISNLVCFKEF